jgi:hypothetical protein
MRLLVAIPSRGRPERLRKTLTEGLRLSTAETDFAVGIDTDDTSGYRQLAEELDSLRVKWVYRPRDTLTGWTNKLVRLCPGYEAYGSIGDDHVPATESWDYRLLAAIAGGAGIVYPNDTVQGRNLATAVVVSARITQALDWLCCPFMAHYWVDNVWMELGRGADCLSYEEGVIVRHEHYTSGGSVEDPTYTAAYAAHWESDAAAYQRWCAQRRAADVDTVRKALA